MGYHKSLAGVGAVTAIPSGANPANIDLAVISSLKFDHEEEDVDLEGDGLDVLDSYVASRKVTGTIEVSEFSSKLVNMVTTGVTVTPSLSKIGATHSAVVPTTPFQITPPATGGTWDTTLVVVDLTAGKQLTQVASAPATGQFSVTAGVYTFASADTGHTIFFRYRLASAAAGVQAKVAAASGGGASAKYQLHCYNGNAGKNSGIYIPAARIPGFSAAFEKKGWVKTTLKWKAMIDANNDLYYTWTPE